MVEEAVEARNVAHKGDERGELGVVAEKVDGQQAKAQLEARTFSARAIGRGASRAKRAKRALARLRGGYGPSAS